MRLVLMVFLLVSTVFIHQGEAQTGRRMLKEAEEAYEKGEKLKAIDIYLAALKKNPEDAYLSFMTGKLYLETIYKTKSLPYLEKSYKANPKIDIEINRFLAESFHFNHKFDDAIKHYNLAIASPTNDPFYKQIDRRIYECNNGQYFLDNPVEAKLENIGSVINSSYAEYAPIVNADETILIFTSRRAGSSGNLLDEQGEYYEDIYISNKVNNEWSTPKAISSAINTDFHDASIGMSPDGKTLFIYKDEGNGDIFYCKIRKDGSWSRPEPMGPVINTSKYYENAATISADGKRLFFTSTRPGGQGKLDIYMSELDSKGRWKEAVNLGRAVNTEYDEECPFFDLDNKTLYFSSRGHKGMGGFDIFKTVYDEKTKFWSEPQNLGYPINSSDDDVHFALSGDGRHGYFTSVKDGGFGEKDIYKIIMPPRDDYEQLISKIEEIMERKIARDTTLLAKNLEKVPVKLYPVTLKGEVSEVITGKKLSVVVQLNDEYGNLIKEVKAGEDGMFSFTINSDKKSKYSLTTEKSGYGFVSKEFELPAKGHEPAEFVHDLKLKKLDVGSRFILRNIYFDFDKDILKKESDAELTKVLKLLNENPSLRVEIGGHTDSFGSSEYNKDLSQRRSQSVVEWLVQKGIERNRLVAKGYGEEQPLASNDDEKEGRELNRRTELKVLSK